MGEHNSVHGLLLFLHFLVHTEKLVQVSQAWICKIVWFYFDAGLQCTNWLSVLVLLTVAANCHATVNPSLNVHKVRMHW